MIFVKAVALYKKYTVHELLALEKKLRDDPSSKETDPGSIFPHNKKTRDACAQIALAITYHMEDRREANGNPINRAGYTGRQSKRR